MQKELELSMAVQEESHRAKEMQPFVCVCGERVGGSVEDAEGSLVSPCAFQPVSCWYFGVQFD